jgi:anti-anti-sigma factor
MRRKLSYILVGTSASVLIALGSPLVDTAMFMPHGHCYLWNTGVVVLHAGSDSLIFLTYLTIALTLGYFARKRGDLPFDWMFLAFGTFTVACGTTHLMEVVTLWTPVYWLSGVVKAVTAVLSVVTALLLVRLIPKALALPSPTLLREANGKLAEQARQLEIALAERGALEEQKLQLAKEQQAAQTEIIRLQDQRLDEMAVPVVPIMDHVLVMPLIGVVDSKRARRVLDTVIESAHRRAARVVIVDVTGLTHFDTQAIGTLIEIGKALRLVGAEVVLTGIGAEIATTLVKLGINLEGLVTLATLQDGVARAMCIARKQTA